MLLNIILATIAIVSGLLSCFVFKDKNKFIGWFINKIYFLSIVFTASVFLATLIMVASDSGYGERMRITRNEIIEDCSDGEVSYETLKKIETYNENIDQEYFYRYETHGLLDLWWTKEVADLETFNINDFRIIYETESE